MNAKHYSNKRETRFNSTQYYEYDYDYELCLTKLGYIAYGDKCLNVYPDLHKLINTVSKCKTSPINDQRRL